VQPRAYASGTGSEEEERVALLEDLSAFVIILFLALTFQKKSVDKFKTYFVFSVHYNIILR
jgi:hypothetical protein